MTSSKTQKDILSVVVRDRTGLLFEGAATAVSSYNANGLFDVLPLHSNFICIIRNMVVVHTAPSLDPVKIPLEQGVLKVRENKVEVYAGV